MPDAYDVAHVVRRNIASRKANLAAAGLDDTGTRATLSLLDDVTVTVHRGTSVRVYLPRSTDALRHGNGVLTAALDADLAALGFPADVARNATITDLVDGLSAELTW